VTERCEAKNGFSMVVRVLGCTRLATKRSLAGADASHGCAGCWRAALETLGGRSSGGLGAGVDATGYLCPCSAFQMLFLPSQSFQWSVDHAFSIAFSVWWTGPAVDGAVCGGAGVFWPGGGGAFGVFGGAGFGFVGA
jgi:hypothetical protein